jgi:glutamate synthase domain-containing protein 2
MRNYFYYAFGVFLLGVFLFLVMFHRTDWMWVVIVPLAIIFLHDIFQKKHAVLRNFPVLGHIRYILEFIRPEIRQYLIAGDQEERPYDRETRTLIYERSKNIRDTIPFGTQRDILEIGYELSLIHI